MVAVLADDEQWKWFEESMDTTVLCRVADVKVLAVDCVGLICMNANHYDIASVSKPVFINSVTTPLYDMNIGKNIIRFNGWNTFFQKNDWEVAGEINEAVITIGKMLGKKLLPVKDEAGFVAARIVSMIINEAYFALEDKVSTKEQIDTAMKLGTNYPYGPFEWAEKIGIEKVEALLIHLSKQQPLYTPSTLLSKEAHT